MITTILTVHTSNIYYRFIARFPIGNEPGANTSVSIATLKSLNVNVIKSFIIHYLSTRTLIAMIAGFMHVQMTVILVW